MIMSQLGPVKPSMMHGHLQKEKARHSDAYLSAASSWMHAAQLCAGSVWHKYG